MNGVVDMAYLDAIENKARGELENFVQNNMATLNVIRLAKLGLLAQDGKLVPAGSVSAVADERME